MNADTCTRCAGSGIVPCFRHINGGICYACDGSGSVEGTPKSAPRGATPGRTVNAGRFGLVFVARAPKGHLTATTERGDAIPFEVRDGRAVECPWFTRYSGRTADLLAALSAHVRA